MFSPPPKPHIGSGRIRSGGPGWRTAGSAPISRATSSPISTEPRSICSFPSRPPTFGGLPKHWQKRTGRTKGSSLASWFLDRRSSLREMAPAPFGTYDSPWRPPGRSTRFDHLPNQIVIGSNANGPPPPISGEPSLGALTFRFGLRVCPLSFVSFPIPPPVFMKVPAPGLPPARRG